MDHADGVITITPADAPAARGLESYAGIARGAWGRSPEEVEQHIADDPDSWQR
jgi:hypothetical protein